MLYRHANTKLPSFVFCLCLLLLFLLFPASRELKMTGEENKVTSPPDMRTRIYGSGQRSRSNRWQYHYVADGSPENERANNQVASDMSSPIKLPDISVVMIARSCDVFLYDVSCAILVLKCDMSCDILLCIMRWLSKLRIKKYHPNTVLNLYSNDVCTLSKLRIKKYLNF